MFVIVSTCIRYSKKQLKGFQANLHTVYLTPQMTLIYYLRPELSKLGAELNLLSVNIVLQVTFQKRELVYVFIIVFFTNYRKRYKIIRCILVKK